MNWEAVGAVGELIGAIGLFVSIFYLAVQKNQQNEITRAQFGFPLARGCTTDFLKRRRTQSFANY